MSELKEKNIEAYIIEELQTQGYQYIGTARDFREDSSEVVLWAVLKEAIARINTTIPEQAREEALKQVVRLGGLSSVLDDNEAFHKMLTEGINVSYRKDGNQRGDKVWLVDFKKVAHNDFRVANQFTVLGKNRTEKRPDVVLFINGLPLVVMELKGPLEERATLLSAYRQIETYKTSIPKLFIYNSVIIISDGIEARAGSLSAKFNRFMSWKSTEAPTKMAKNPLPIALLIKGMLDQGVLLDYIGHFTVFEKSRKKDLKTGIVTIELDKKIAAYHQYYAVNKAVKSTQKASSENGERKAGVIWHTQGSGKSLSMVFYSGKIIANLNNPTILVITDRNDLDNQLFDTFASARQLLRQDPEQAKDRRHLKELLKVASGGVVFTTIQKFQPEEGNTYETLSERKNIVVLADEAHRTQYGFGAKTLDERDAKGKVVGKKTTYGFAKYMRDALPNATYIGFTGTPVEKADANTRAVFGGYVDIYDISQAVKDGATVEIFYESRLAKMKIDKKSKKLIQQTEDELQEIDFANTQKPKAKWTKLEIIVGNKKRIKNIAKDIMTHFEKRQKVLKGKGMIVVMSRRIATELYGAIVNLKPHWHSDDLGKGAIKVVMTSSSSDGVEMAKHHTTKLERKDLAQRMKDPDNPLQLVIVVDMWLTGFDAPPMHTLYIDKPMKGHNLMQAIARVNRVYKDKPGGLIVDYLGIASELKNALNFYSENGGSGTLIEDKKNMVFLALEKLEIISRMFVENSKNIFSYQSYFKADTQKKLEILLEAQEYILGINGKERFIKHVTDLSKAFALAVPHPKVMEIRDEVGFFQEIKSRLQKWNTSTSEESNIEIESIIKQSIDKALVAGPVINIFDTLGISSPNISILSDDFLKEIKALKHKNIAIETLKKLLNDEIKSRRTTNLVQSNSLMEMLQEAIIKYQNRSITATEVIETLINLANHIKQSDKKDKDSGLSKEELAFYYAVAENKSDKEVLGNKVLRELSIYLTETIKKNVTIDWTKKENVRARLRVKVKRALKKFGYPPDARKLAIDNVIKQAEHSAEYSLNN